MSKQFFCVENIKVSKGDKTIIDDISFKIKPGELISILGPSGSGKTTLINTLMGFNQIEAGKIICNDEVISTKNINKDVGQRFFSAVFQALNLFPHLSVKENILYGISKESKDKQHTRLMDLASIVGLEDKLSRDIDTLSGGEKQRVAIARSLAPRPVILFLDEPFSSLDKNLQVEVRSFIKKILKDSGIASFLVTHDKEDAFYFSDRVMLLNKGKIIQFDTPEKIYNEPANDFVASFFGLTLKLYGPGGDPLYPCPSKVKISKVVDDSKGHLIERVKVIDHYFNLGEFYNCMELKSGDKVTLRSDIAYEAGDHVYLYINNIEQ